MDSDLHITVQPGYKISCPSVGCVRQDHSSSSNRVLENLKDDKAQKPGQKVKLLSSIFCLYMDILWTLNMSSVSFMMASLI